MVVYLERTLKHILELGGIAVGKESQPGQGNQSLAKALSQPGITGIYLLESLSAIDDELLGRTVQAVVVALEGNPPGGLTGKHSGQSFDGYRRCGYGNHHRLSLLNGELEISGRIEVLLILETAAFLLEILDVVVPVGIMEIVVLLVELEVDSGETVIEPVGGSVLHGHVSAVRVLIGLGQGMYLPE